LDVYADQTLLDAIWGRAGRVPNAPGVTPKGSDEGLGAQWGEGFCSLAGAGCRWLVAQFPAPLQVGPHAPC